MRWRHTAEAGTRSSVTVIALPAGSPARYALFFSDWTKSAVALNSLGINIARAVIWMPCTKT